MKESLVQNKESSIENTQKSTRKIGVWWILCFISKEGFKNLCFSVPSDGAGRWKQILHVTIPCILPMILLMMVLSIGNVLQAGFEQIFNLYSPQVYATGDIIDTYVYRIGMIESKFDLATAVGLFKSVISFILIVAGYKLADKVAGYKVF